MAAKRAIAGKGHDAAADAANKKRAPRSKGNSGKTVKLLSSKLAYRGPLFDVTTDFIREPGG